MVIFPESVRDFPLSMVLFSFFIFFQFLLMQLHASSGCMSEGADTSHFSGPWSEGHKSRERDISHCAFQEVHHGLCRKKKPHSNSLAAASSSPPPATIDRWLADLWQWKIDETEPLSALTSVPSGLSWSSWRSLSRRLLVSVTLRLATG